MRVNEKNPQRYGWQRYLFYRKESLKTTWKLRLAVLLVGLAVVWISRELLAVRMAESLVCTEQISHSDALLLENFDRDYLVFERAAALREAGVASRLLVPVNASRDPDRPNRISGGIAELMARVARIPNIEMIPIELIEPISLNAANQIRDFLTRERLRSVVVVSPAFRSRRSLLVYNEMLAPAGIAVDCAPVFGNLTPANWTESWHGIQDLGLQFLKLQYYRFYVLW